MPSQPFVKDQLKISFLAAADSGADWFRTQLPEAELRRYGHHLWNTRPLPPSRFNSDVLVASRPIHNIWEQFADKNNPTYAHRPTLVVDFDDNYIDVPKDNPGYQDSMRYRDQLIRNMEVSDGLIVTSQKLAEAYEPYNENIYIVPNGLPYEILQTTPNAFHPQPRTSDGSREIITIGVVATGSTAYDVITIKEQIKKFLGLSTRHRDVRLVIIGKYAHELPALLGVPSTDPILDPRNEKVLAVGWMQYGTPYLEMLSTIDILVAPYRDHIYNHGKFPTKALESSFLGIPLVASAIDPYSNWITHGEDGFLISLDENKKHEWGKYVKKLVDSQELRQKFSWNIRRHAPLYNMHNLGALWNNTLKAIWFKHHNPEFLAQ